MILKIYTSFDKNLPNAKSILLIEKALNIKLRFGISKSGNLFPINDIEEFLSLGRQNKALEIMCNGDERNLISFSGIYLSKDFGYADTELWYIILKFHDVKSTLKLMEFLLDLGDHLNSFWGSISPRLYERETKRQFFHISKDGVIADLPRLYSFTNYSSPVIPTKLGWINYWSNKTCKELDVDLCDLEKVDNIRTAKSNNGISFAIDQEPITLHSKKHIELLNEIYLLYPKIGGRSANKST